MTPKNKAINLLNKFKKKRVQKRNEIISCALALINIENQINTIEKLIKLCNPDNYMIFHLENELQELQEIKKEIEKL